MEDLAKTEYFDSSNDSITKAYLFRLRNNDLIYLRDYENKEKFYRITYVSESHILIGGNNENVSFPSQNLSFINHDNSVHYNVENNNNKDYLNCHNNSNNLYFSSKILDLREYVCGTIIEISNHKDGISKDKDNLEGNSNNNSNYEYLDKDGNPINSEFYRIEEIISSSLIRVKNLFNDNDIDIYNDIKKIKNISFGCLIWNMKLIQIQITDI